MIDVKVTPNRPDALGIRGIARDLAAKGLGKLKPLDAKPVPGTFESPSTSRSASPAATPNPARSSSGATFAA